MRRVVAAACVAAFAVAPLLLGALPLGRGVALGVAVLALAGVVAVWRAPGLALSVAAVGLTLATADLATRPFLNRVHVRAEDRYARLWRVDPSGVAHDANVDVLWPTVGNLAAQGGAVREPRTVHFRTDAHGFRTDPLDGPAEVVLLSDSFGAGVGSSQEVLAAARLTARYGLPTVNLSVSGASPYDEAVTLAATLDGLDLAPDATLVWMLFAGNDFEGTCEATVPGPPSAWNRLRAWVATVRVRSVIGYLFRRLRAEPPVPSLRHLPDGTPMTFYAPDLAHADLTEEEASALPQAACVRGVVPEVQRLAASRGLRLIVAVAPMKVQVYGRYVGLGDPVGGPTAALRSFAAARRIPVVDLEPALAEAARAGLPEGRLVWWRDDTHWNAAGHAVVARVLADAIRADTSGIHESGASVR